MTREECETLILQKVKEIKAIVKKSTIKAQSFYLNVSIRNEFIDINNTYWETDTPLCVALFDDGSEIHYDN